MSVTFTFPYPLTNVDNQPTGTTFVVITIPTSVIPPPPSTDPAAKTSLSPDDGWDGPPPPFIIRSLASEYGAYIPSGSSNNAGQTSGVSGGAIAGIVIGGVTVVLLIFALVLVALHQKSSSEKQARYWNERRSGSSERALNNTSRDDGEKRQQQQQLAAHRRGWNGLPYFFQNRRKKKDTDEQAHKKRQAELEDTPARIFEISAHQPCTSLAELQNHQGPGTVNAFTGASTTEAPEAELSNGALNNLHETQNGQPSQHEISDDGRLPMAADCRPLPFMYEHSTIDDETAQHELDANRSSKADNSPQSPRQFPYEGLLQKYVDKR